MATGGMPTLVPVTAAPSRPARRRAGRRRLGAAARSVHPARRMPPAAAGMLPAREQRPRCRGDRRNPGPAGGGGVDRDRSGCADRRRHQQRADGGGRRDQCEQEQAGQGQPAARTAGPGPGGPGRGAHRLPGRRQPDGVRERNPPPPTRHRVGLRGGLRTAVRVGLRSRPGLLSRIRLRRRPGLVAGAGRRGRLRPGRRRVRSDLAGRGTTCGGVHRRGDGGRVGRGSAGQPGRPAGWRGHGGVERGRGRAAATRAGGTSSGGAPGAGVGTVVLAVHHPSSITHVGVDVRSGRTLVPCPGTSSAAAPAATPSRSVDRWPRPVRRPACPQGHADTVKLLSAVAVTGRGGGSGPVAPRRVPPAVAVVAVVAAAADRTGCRPGRHADPAGCRPGRARPDVTVRRVMRRIVTPWVRSRPAVLTMRDRLTMGSMNPTSGAEVPRMSPRIHLPSGWVTFVFTDIEGSTRLAQTARRRTTARCSREHRRLLRAHAGRDRRRGAADRGRLVLPGLRRRGRGAGRLPDRAAGAGHPRLADPGGRARGYGWGCTPATPSRATASTPAPRCTGRPGWPPPRTVGRCSARRRPPAGRAAARRAPPCSTWACTGCAASTTGNGCSNWSRPGLERQFPRPAYRRRGGAQPAHPGHLVRRPGGRAGRAGPAGRGSTGWSPWSARAAPARPGSPSRWPAGWSRRTRTGSGSSTSPR